LPPSSYFERVFETEALLGPGHHYLTVERQQQAADARAADDSLGNGAVVSREAPVDDHHLRDEALGIHDQIRPAAVVADGKVARDAGALRKGFAGPEHRCCGNETNRTDQQAR
jgi:hypothetical protein